MSEPENQDAQWALVTEVQELALGVDRLSSDMQLVAAETNANTIARRRDQQVITALRRGVIALLIIVALLMGVLFFGAYLYRQQQHFNSRQACTNSRSHQFFTAELAKVKGQVAGLEELKTAGTDKAKALEGFNQFIAATEHYITAIKTIRGNCA